MYKLWWTRQGKKDYDTAVRAGYKAEMAEILSVVRKNPYEPTPGHHFERLVGNLKGYCSRQVNHNNRFMYKVLPNTDGVKDGDGNLYEGIVQVFRAWEHDYKKPKR